MLFIPCEETCSKSSGHDLSRMLATAKTHTNYSGKGWFRSSGRYGTLYRVCFGVLITMKTVSRSTYKKKTKPEVLDTSSEYVSA